MWFSYKLLYNAGQHLFCLFLSERFVEDHEILHNVQRQWPNPEHYKMSFRKDFRKFEVFRNPAVRISDTQKHTHTHTHTQNTHELVYVNIHTYIHSIWKSCSMLDKIYMNLYQMYLYYIYISNTHTQREEREWSAFDK